MLSKLKIHNLCPTFCSHLAFLPPSLLLPLLPFLCKFKFPGKEEKKSQIILAFKLWRKRIEIVNLDHVAIQS